ncbi:TetR family transcriptional regulator C-terminal domain-containing protein [Amycolatopsis rhabdoformis]|uniref:TetR family transcriptional regulator C-terminal domain-containing protein n=1 Tax=Amycolatopsis rhabdoformis TaxID=1448059 RepID=A0ABZ1IEB9_9PSEU|nr:TetR family transcriptional regulator C-terminal domain-containing protein [Amycolatopsis rhabdoformis]WSE32436.1 TetR family transcriptional regulator C-terminal domain-containing protein [Amycolatopsis rhabdoformis]
MEEPEGTTQKTRLTARGAATRSRIVQAAVDLIQVKGVASTTLDDVRAASSTSKSQLYHHFPDKKALVREVVAAQGAQLIARQEDQLRRLNSIRGLERWRDALVQRASLRDGAYGCAIGSLAAELADRDQEARSMLAKYFEIWEELLAEGLTRMRASGALRRNADPEKLATFLVAALQGGYLLAQTAHSTEPLKLTLDLAIDHIRTFLAQ